MTIIVDIDGTICLQPADNKYAVAEPIPNNIAKINELFEAGHRIIFWTGRGSLSGIDWREVTEFQLEAWGAKYHELWFKKPVYDMWIDDRAINADRITDMIIQNGKVEASV